MFYKVACIICLQHQRQYRATWRHQMPEAIEKWHRIKHTASRSLDHSSRWPSSLFSLFQTKKKSVENWGGSSERKLGIVNNDWGNETTWIWLFPGRICCFITQSRIKVIGLDWICQVGLKIISLLLSRKETWKSWVYQNKVHFWSFKLSGITTLS